MKHGLLGVFLSVFLLLSCSEEEDFFPDNNLTPYELSVVDYFIEVALGFEFGNASKVTRKWEGNMYVFIGGEISEELKSEFEKIQTEINSLTSDGFKIQTTTDSIASNFYIFIGSVEEYIKIFPNEASTAVTNWGLFHLNWNSLEHLTSGHMYIDSHRANPLEQKHLLREELTQSLGLANDSPLYNESIFQSKWTTTTAYTNIDKDLIRLLYHPKLTSGLNAYETDVTLIEIITNSKN